VSRDTSAEAQKVQDSIFREMSPRRKVELVEEANRTARELALAGIRSRHPGATEEQVFRLLMDLTLGAELAEKVYGPLPDVAGDGP
jgi:hypothetical protein